MYVYSIYASNEQSLMIQICHLVTYTHTPTKIHLFFQYFKTWLSRTWFKHHDTLNLLNQKKKIPLSSQLPLHSLRLPQWSRTPISVDVRVGHIHQRTMGNGINQWQWSSALKTMAHKHLVTSGRMRERQCGGWARVWGCVYVCASTCASRSDWARGSNMRWNGAAE